MSRRIRITLPFYEKIEEKLKKQFPEVQDFRILCKSLDARGANRGKTPRFHYDLEIIHTGESFSQGKLDKQGKYQFAQLGPLVTPPIIVGAGPAGLFCALRLIEHGIPSIIVERGRPAHQRMLDIAKFWRYGSFNSDSNVCFGEGGAGLFSDGKLITRIKSPHVQYVMDQFVKFGAPAQTAYLSNPHLGSNKIRTIISQISAYLTQRGCQILYNSRVDDFIFDANKNAGGIQLGNGKKIHSPHIILATGHSAKDIYQCLMQKNVEMASKAFSVGVRVEHPRAYMDKLQLGKFANQEEIGSSSYKMSWKNEVTLKGIYSFCMCPGGYVLSSGTDKDGIVVNGMSNSKRSSPWSNAAIVVTVKAGEDFKSISDGINFQYSIEKEAFSMSQKLASGRELPAMTLGSFLTDSFEFENLPKTSAPSKVVSTPFNQLFPTFVTKNLKDGFLAFEKKLAGFCFDKALIIAPETRTSSPVTILRDKDLLESTSHAGFYPCGEGAGYAGGITSAAVDGIRVANALIRKTFSI